MPRVPRVELDNALYHVHARAAPGRSLFDDLEEARDFVRLLRELAERDGWTVYAWVLLPKSYHLAVRTAAQPLSRTMHALQGRYAQAFNRRHSTFGSVWNGRFQARWVDGGQWMKELVLYIHAQPLTSGLVDDPVAHLFSGHGELVGRDRTHIVDSEVALESFSSEPSEARQVYSACLRRAVHERWCQGPPTSLPWWTAEVLPDRSGSPRGGHRVSEEQLIDEACRVMGVDRDEVTSRRRARDAVACRQVIATVGVETCGLRTRDIAEAMRKNADWISCVCSRGSRRRKVDPEFQDLCARVEAALSGSYFAEGEAVEAVPPPIEKLPASDDVPKQESPAAPADGWAVWS